MPDPVEIVRGHAGGDGLAHLCKSLACDLARDPHPFDGLGILDLGSHEFRRGRAVNVFGPGDVGRDAAAGGLDPRHERLPSDGHGGSLGARRPSRR